MFTGCAGQAADAVSAYTQVRMEDAPRLLKVQKNRNVQTFGYVNLHTNGLNHGPVWKTQWFLLSVIFTVILWQNCHGEGNMTKFYWSTVRRRFLLGNAYSCTVKGWFLSVYGDDIKLAGKKQKILTRCGRYWINNLIWRAYIIRWPCSLGVHSKPIWKKKKNKDTVDKYRTVFESRISAEATKNNQARKHWVFQRAPTIWKVVPRSVWNEIVSWRTKLLSNFTEYLLHAWMTINSKKKNWNPWENCQTYAPKSSWNVLYLARIGRHDIVWSVNKLARSTAKWTRACDKRQARLISYIHFTSEYKQCCHVGNTATAMPIGTVSRFWFCGRPCRFKSQLQVEHCVWSEATH